jgi:O-acetyl-ADP-ribose deacetylase (regulator of RNase III)
MENIRIIKGDITKLKVDAIVNAANSGLRGGGGVDGAIHRAGGPAIMEACRKIGGCPTGEAVITTAGNLPCKYVIHTVGPVWEGGNNHEEELLAKAYFNSLTLAIKNGVKSIAFPNISTGVYGFPKRKAAEIALKASQKFIKSHESDMEITFVCFDEENFQLYRDLILQI